jgi:hypothetical protein
MFVGGINLLICLFVQAATVQPSSSESASPTSADFHYRIFVADAALVDRLIPVEQRQVGVMSNVKPELVEAQVTAASTNGVFTKTDSQMAMINSATLGALLAGMETKPGLLVEGHSQLSVQRNNNSVGTDIGWAHGFADRTLSANSAGGGLVKLQRQAGILQARIECQFQYQANNNPNLVLSKILYFGSAPQPGTALAFLVPFVSNDKTAHYLVIVFDLGNSTEQAVPATTAQNLSFGPVMERTIERGSSSHRALNLASGEFMSPSRDREFVFRPDGADTLRVAGVDVYSSDDARAADNLNSLDMRYIAGIYPQKGDRGISIDDINAEEFSGLLAKGQYFQTMLEKSGMFGGYRFDLSKVEPVLRGTNVYLFITRDGAQGILQISGVTENPPGVKIRYKLLQQAGTNVEPVPAPTLENSTSTPWKNNPASISFPRRASPLGAGANAKSKW